MVSTLEDKVFRVKGEIFIRSHPEKIWAILTDYDNLENFLPTLQASRLLQDHGDEKIMTQTIRTGILVFKKTVQVTWKIREKHLKQIHFEMIQGDFKTYKGEMSLEYDQEARGTMLTYTARAKPDFWAPQAAVRHVQKHDVSRILEAIKRRVEE